MFIPMDIIQGVKYCGFFSRILESLPPLPGQITANSIALRALKVCYSDVGEGGVAVNCEKTQLFLNTLYIVEYEKGRREFAIL